MYINKAISDAIPDEIPQLKQAYKELATMRREIGAKFKTDEQGLQTLRNLSGKAKEIFLEKLGKMDKRLGTDLVKDAELAQAYHFFGKPSSDVISIGGSVSSGKAIPLAAAGGMLGYLSTKEETPEMRTLATILGTVAGGKMGSPAALRAAMELGHVPGSVGTAVKGALPQSVRNVVESAGTSAGKGVEKVRNLLNTTKAPAANAAAFEYVRQRKEKP
jgi:hypothetical protein